MHMIKQKLVDHTYTARVLHNQIVKHPAILSPCRSKHHHKIFRKIR